MANYWSTEPAASWAPCDLEVADWTVRGEPVAGVWAPPGLPVEYVSTHMFGTGLQAYVPESGGGQQQLVEYNYYNYYAAAAQHHHDPTGKAMTTQEDLPSFQDEKMETYMKNPKKLFQQRKDEFKADAKLMKMKMHRYPPIQAFGISVIGVLCPR